MNTDGAAKNLATHHATHHATTHATVNATHYAIKGKETKRKKIKQKQMIVKELEESRVDKNINNGNHQQHLLLLYFF